MTDENTIAGQVVELRELVAYQDGSVVSKTLIKRDGGTVTLFAFAADQSLSEHTAPFDAMVQVLDGEVEVIIGGETNIIKAGQAIVMPADVPHALKAVTAFKMLLTMVK